jgi:hypothetical protein
MSLPPRISTIRTPARAAKATNIPSRVSSEFLLEWLFMAMGSFGFDFLRYLSICQVFTQPCRILRPQANQTPV